MALTAQLTGPAGPKPTKPAAGIADPPLFSKPLLIRHGCELLPWLIAAWILPEKFDALLYLALGGWIAYGSRVAPIKALTVSFLLVHVNSDVFGMPSPKGLHLLLPFLALGRLLLSNRSSKRLFALGIVKVYTLLTTAVILHSLYFSVMPAVSILKVISFATYFAAVVGNIANAEDRRHEVSSWFSFVIAAVVILNLPMLFVPAGRYRNGRGFNGMLNHPNALGVFLAVGVARLVSHALLARRLSIPLAALLLLASFQLFKTESRGGLFTLVIAASFWAGMVLSTSPRTTTRVVSRLFLAAVVLVPTALLFSQNLASQVQSFISKSGRSTASGLIANFQQSRGGAIEKHLSFFRENPIGGVGFQVVDTRSGRPTDVVFDPIFRSIPISAAVENGFLYTSILAEGGLLGAPVMYGFLVVLLLNIARRKGSADTIIPIAVLLINVSEATFFSPSGIGGWCLLLCGLSLVPLPRSQPAKQGTGRRTGHSTTPAFGAARRSGMRHAAVSPVAVSGSADS